MRTLLTTVCILALSLGVGCSAPIEEEESTQTSESALKGGVRPIRGTCSLSFAQIGGGFQPPIPGNPNFGPFVVQRDTGTCELSHLGPSTYNGTNTIYFGSGTTVGTRTITADNGDTLIGTSRGSSSPPINGVINFSANITWTGGTGRFSDANGTATGSGQANVGTRQTSLSINGRIDY